MADASLIRTTESGGANRGFSVAGEYIKFDTGTNASSTINEAARIDSSGRLLVGTNNGSGNSTAHFQGNAGASIGGAFISLQRGSTNPSNGTELATISFADNAPSQGARIQAFTDGDWAASDYPGSPSVLHYCGWGEFSDGADEDWE
jgi:hypothetical protein